MDLYRITPALFALAIVLLGWLLSPKLSNILQSRVDCKDQDSLMDCQRPVNGFPRRLEFCLILGIVLLAVGLRSWGLTFGLPGSYFHPDELMKAPRITKMIRAEDFNPRYFLHPPLLLYLSKGMYLFLHWLQDFGLSLLPHWRSFDQIILSGRLVSLIAGSLSPLLLWIIGRRCFSKEVGLTAGFLLAVFPLHVSVSRYLKEDALLLFFLLLAGVFLASVISGGDVRKLVLAGVSFGLAMATKYPGALSLPLMFLPFIIAVQRRISADLSTGNLCGKLRDAIYEEQRLFFWSCAGIAVVLPVFLATHPYSIISYDKFMKGVHAERSHMLTGHMNVVVRAWDHLWSYQWARNIVPGVGFISAVLAVFALGDGIRRRDSALGVLFVLFLLYYIPSEWVRAKSERYVVPCLPLIALGISVFLSRIYALRTINGVLLLIIVLVAPAIRTVVLSKGVAYDTRVQAARWIEENIPLDKKLCLLSGGYSSARFSGPKALELKLNKAVTRYKIRNLKRQGCDYLVTSDLYYRRFLSEYNRDVGARRVIQKWFTHYPVIKEFIPGYRRYSFHNPHVVIIDTSMKIADTGSLDRYLPKRSVWAMFGQS